MTPLVDCGRIERPLAWRCRAERASQSSGTCSPPGQTILANSRRRSADAQRIARCFLSHQFSGRDLPWVEAASQFGVRRLDGCHGRSGVWVQDRGRACLHQWAPHFAQVVAARQRSGWSFESAVGGVWYYRPHSVPHLRHERSSTPGRRRACQHSANYAPRSFYSQRTDASSGTSSQLCGGRLAARSDNGIQ